jgi:membrane-associated phospholipid phosphatase
VVTNLQRILDTTAILLFFALPVTVMVGGLLFVPWQRRYWNLQHWTRMLATHGWVIVGLVFMLVPAFIESTIDPIMDELHGLEFTGFFMGVEAGLHPWLQAALADVQFILRPLLTAAYVGGYPVLIILTPFLGIWLNERILARRALGAYALSFAFALPFYLFFPVREVWHAYDPTNQGAVQNLAIQYDWVHNHIYAYNELNNCFPSLHTAISVAMAAVAWRSGAPKSYVVFATALAGLIVVSTVYLGIHWVLDVVAGLVLAAIVVRLVERLWPRLEPPPRAAL